jgi:hypothetical protein
LPANNRYVLYTPKGGTFMANQKDRLKEKGITHMHMKKEEISSAKTYTAQNYLNNKVDAFNQSKEEKDKIGDTIKNKPTEKPSDKKKIG